ncbi:MAG: serine hydrolase [Tissierellia bacterium]|nr:serine hydrolase [Tissierellia bacterium]
MSKNRRGRVSLKMPLNQRRRAEKLHRARKAARHEERNKALRRKRVRLNVRRLVLFLLVLSLLIGGAVAITQRLNTRSDETLAPADPAGTEDLEVFSEAQAQIPMGSSTPERHIGVPKKASALENLIKSYLRRNGIAFEQIGFSYYNFATDVSLNMNEDEIFVAASIMKVPINMLTYDLIESGDIDEDTKLTYTSRDVEGGTGILQGEPIGGDYELREVLKLSIVESDNVATNMLYRYLGGVNQEYLLDSLARVYGIHSYGGNEMTPSDAMNILTLLYENTEDGGHYSELLKDMKNTNYNQYFNRDIKGVSVAHKTGDYDGYFNDIGIVYDQEPFAFAIFTDNIPYPDEVMANLGKIVYDWHIEVEEPVTSPAINDQKKP